MSEKKPSGYHLEHLRASLGDRFDLRNEIGSGAFATVYLARNLRLGRMEALKVLFDRGDRSFGRRFAEEVKLVASLDHPNIVKVYDHGQAEGFIWCSMQLIDGPTLRDELEMRGRFEPDDTVRLMIPLLDALAYSHEAGTIHRDVKPSNIILDRHGRPFLMDFGIAKSVQNARQTMTRGILGTPTYISPEQLSKKELDGRADLYALGVTMYEMLAGRPPFVAEDVVQTVVKRLMEDPEPLSAHLPSVDPRLEAVVHRALARKPEQRFADATRMREALVEVVGSDWQKVAWPLPKVASGLDGGNDRGLDLGEEATTVMEHPPGTRRTAPGIYAGGFVLLVLLTLGGWLLASRSTRESPVASGPPAVSTLDAEPRTEEGSEPPDEPETELSTGEENQAEDVPVQVSGEPTTTSPVSDAGREESVEEATESTPSLEGPPPAAEEPPPPPASRPSAAPAQEEVFLRPVVPPRLRSTVEPSLNPEAAGQCVGGEVVLTVQVSATGTVERTRVLRSESPECARAAEAAAMQYEFEPARGADGQELPGSTTISVRFTESQP